MTILVSVSLFAQDNPQQPTKGSILCSTKKMMAANSILEEKANLPHSFNVLDYKIYLDIYSCFISPYPKSFSANVIITLRADSVISSINLNAVATSLQINSVALAGASFTQNGDILTVILNRSYVVGETLQVKIKLST
jgi:hypothetical protein